jgi:hypothetical protein
MTFNRLAATLLFTTIAAAACLMPAQSDTYWQLRAGQEMWQSGHLLYRDTFSHTVYGHYWSNHEWLTEVAFYGAHRIAGMAGIALLCASAVSAGWVCAWRLMRGTPIVRTMLVAGAMTGAATLWSLRPQAISLGFVGLTAWLVATRRYKWIPAVFVLWANFHGAALLGIVMMCGAAAGALAYDRAAARRLLLVLPLAALAMCATPLGVSWWPGMIVSLERIGGLGISEWAPASFTSLHDLPFWIAGVGLIVFAWHRRHTMSAEDAIVTGMALALFPLGVHAGRNTSPFLLVALPALTRLLPDRVVRWELGLARRPGRVAHTCLAYASVGVAVLAVAVSWANPAPRLGWKPLPDAVIEAVNACPPNLYHRYDHGGYFTWFTPQQRVFLDGRQDPFPVELIVEHRARELAGDYRDIFDRFGIRCAALPTSSLVAANLEKDGWQQRASADGWVVLARGEQAASRGVPDQRGIAR